MAGTACLVLGIAWGTAIGGFGTFIKPLTEEMGWSRAAVSGAYSISVMVNFTVGIFWGWLSDRWSVRGVIAITGVLMGAGLFLTGYAQTLWQMYLFFGFIGGVGLGGTAGPLTAITTRWFEQRPGIAIGIIYAGFGAASAVMPILVERLIAFNGWRFSFQVIAIVIWGVFLLGFLLLREPPAPDGRKAQESIARDPEMVDTRREAPSTPRSGDNQGGEELSVSFVAALRTRPFWLLFGMMTAASVVLDMILVHIVPRAEDAGISSHVAVTLLTVNGLVNMVATLGGGGLGDRLGPQRVFLWSMVIMTLSLIWLTGSSSLWMFYVFVVAFGVGNGGWFPQTPILAARIFGKRNLGGIYSAILLGAGVGALVGPTLAGYVFDTTGRYFIAFVIAVVISAVGVVITMLLRRDARRAGQTTAAPEKTG